MSLLDPIRMAFECPLRWEKLVGGDRTRHCADCDKHVFNLSAMTRIEAQQLLDDSETPICIRVEVGADGRARFQPALPGLTASAAVVVAAAIVASGPSVQPVLNAAPSAHMQAAPQPQAPVSTAPIVIERLGEPALFVPPPATPTTKATRPAVAPVAPVAPEVWELMGDIAWTDPAVGQGQSGGEGQVVEGGE
jgi:hypothetical protein